MKDAVRMVLSQAPCISDPLHTPSWRSCFSLPIKLLIKDDVLKTKAVFFRILFGGHLMCFFFIYLKKHKNRLLTLETVFKQDLHLGDALGTHSAAGQACRGLCGWKCSSTAVKICFLNSFYGVITWLSPATKGFCVLVRFFIDSSFPTSLSLRSQGSQESLFLLVKYGVRGQHLSLTFLS